MFEQLNRHLSQYDNMGNIAFMFNQPSFCGQSIVTNLVEKEDFVSGDYSKGGFDFQVNESLILEVHIYGFNKDKKQAKEFIGMISFVGINQINEVIYTGKYNVIATIFIPKDFKKWKEKIGSKSFSEIVP